MTPPAVDFGDVQGLVRHGHGHMTEARFFLLRVADPRAARAWLRAAPGHDRRARGAAARDGAAGGLHPRGAEALAVPAPVVAGFSAEFASGMAGEESRSRRLGDSGASAPADWQWGGPAGARTSSSCSTRSRAARGLGARAMRDPWSAAFQMLPAPPPAPLDGVEPFGFVDGVSQPVLDWDRRRASTGATRSSTASRRPASSCSGIRTSTASTPTARSSTGRTTPGATASRRGRPRPARRRPQRDLSRHPAAPTGRAGLLAVPERQANGDRGARRALAEAMVGRTMTGDPLVGAAAGRFPGSTGGPDDVAVNKFTFDSDPPASHCPLGAHIRRANPRNADLPGHPDGLVEAPHPHARLRPEGHPRGRWSPPRASTGSSGGAASTARRCPSRRRRRPAALGRQGARALLHLPQREHRPAVRVRAERVAAGNEVRRARGGERSAPRQSEPVRAARPPTPSPPAGRWRAAPHHGTARSSSPCAAAAYFFLPGIRALRYLAGSAS